MLVQPQRAGNREFLTLGVFNPGVFNQPLDGFYDLYDLFRRFVRYLGLFLLFFHEGKKRA